MKILSIETSCDETAVSILEIAEREDTSPLFTVLGDGLFSQAHLHAEYGGVYPTLAKREHAKNLVPMLDLALSKAQMKKEVTSPTSLDKENISHILEREPELLEQTLNYLTNIEKPEVDMIAVTQGPGLAPALWIGLNFAKALSEAWNLPLTPVNHMEGHIVSVLQNTTAMRFPAIALLISGGHTQIVEVSNWGEYTILGETRDDAVGEAFDKVARMMGLSYPGGPEISRHADMVRKENIQADFELPRPMLHTDDFDFSFSGLKTAVRNLLEKREINEELRNTLSREFEDAVTEVLIKKTMKAVGQIGAKSLIIAGGVSANKHIQETFEKACKETSIDCYLPQKGLSGDNAIMIGMAGYFTFLRQKKAVDQSTLKALGNLRL